MKRSGQNDPPRFSDPSKRVLCVKNKKMLRARGVGGGGSTTMVATASGVPPARAATGGAAARAATGGAAAPAAEEDPVEVAAAEALVAISTLGRDVPYERVRELVEAVLRSHTKRQHLPVSTAPTVHLQHNSTDRLLL